MDFKKLPKCPNEVKSQVKITPIIFWTRKLFPVPAPPVKNTFRPDLTALSTYLRIRLYIQGMLRVARDA